MGSSDRPVRETREGRSSFLDVKRLAFPAPSLGRLDHPPSPRIRVTQKVGGLKVSLPRRVPVPRERGGGHEKESSGGRAMGRRAARRLERVVERFDAITSFRFSKPACRFARERTRLRDGNKILGRGPVVHGAPRQSFLEN